MYPIKTGSLILEVVAARHDEDVARAADRRRVALAKPASSGRDWPRRWPWWWGLASKRHIA